MEVVHHDPSLARRLLALVHWKLKPKDLQELTDEELWIMEFAYKMQEHRQAELLTDIFGLLLGASWPVNALAPDDETPEGLREPEFTWELRNKVDRISTPLATILGGENFMKHIKQVAMSRKWAKRDNPAILNVPEKEFMKGSEVVELGSKSKDEFLATAIKV